VAIGIDIVADVLRCSEKLENDSFKHHEKYGTLGLVPRLNEPLIWNNPRALRISRPGPYIPLSDVWNEFLINSDGRANWEWESLEGYQEKRPASNLIIDSVKQNFSKVKERRTVLSIENTLDEFQQEALIKSLRLGGIAKSELLWRPVAIALHHLKLNGRDQYNPGERLVIIDLDSFKPEVTILNLKMLRDELVPVRDLPINYDFNDQYSSYNLKREYVKALSDSKDISDQLLNGPYSNEFLKFIEGGECGELFIRQELEYMLYEHDPNWISEIADYKIDGIDFKGLRNDILEIEELNPDDIILWNGFPCRVQNNDIFGDNEIVVEAIAVSSGAADYAQRRDENLPTYLDTLSGLKIYSNVAGGGSILDILIEKGEVEGGKTVRTPQKITKFSLQNNIDIFNAVLVDETTNEAKILKTPIPNNNYNYDVPLILSAEMKPANGHAIVTIEGDDQHKDVFGRKRRIELDWKSMKKFELIDSYSGPEVYPIRGRIGDDIECRDIVREQVRQNGNMSNLHLFRGHNIRYEKLHTSWGSYAPWGEPDERTRAMFGVFIEEGDEISALADSIADLIYNSDESVGKRHKYLNYMHRYAPESFREELRGIYRDENPIISNWNTVYGVGRTFYKKEDFELFVDFMLKKSIDSGYPVYPVQMEMLESGEYSEKLGYVQGGPYVYYWAFFRGLMFYEETNLIPIDKAKEVIKTLILYCQENRLAGNKVKYVLSTILYSLRFRSNGRKFLEEGSDVRAEIADIIQNRLPQIPYPRTMFENVQPDKLNDFVLRFVMEQDTKEDRKALEGLITSMS